MKLCINVSFDDGKERLINRRTYLGVLTIGTTAHNTISCPWSNYGRAWQLSLRATSGRGYTYSICRVTSQPRMTLNGTTELLAATEYVLKPGDTIQLPDNCNLTIHHFARFCPVEDLPQESYPE